MNHIRQEKIRKFVESRSFVTIKEIKELIPDVSLMTIHRDLDALEKQGVVNKHRGGVSSVRFPDDVEFNIRKRENNKGKLEMAKKALSLVEPHSSIFLDSGTSNLLIAENMPDINVNVVTTSPGIALEICRLHNPVVTMCGGTINRKNLGVYGFNTLEMLEHINIDVAFIGVSGYSKDIGFTCGSEEDMYIKRLIIKKARVKVMLCGSEKLTRLMPYTFASLSDANYLISDEPLPDDFNEVAKNLGIIIM